MTHDSEAGDGRSLCEGRNGDLPADDFGRKEFWPQLLFLHGAKELGDNLDKKADGSLADRTNPRRGGFLEVKCEHEATADFTERSATLPSG